MAGENFVHGFVEGATLNFPAAPVALAEGAGVFLGVASLIGVTVFAARKLLGAK